MLATVTVFGGETEEQALSRTLGWMAERKEILGYIGGMFVVKGRTCIEQPVRLAEQLQYLKSPESLAVATSRRQLELERERPQLIAARAQREATTNQEFIQLLRKYSGET